MVDGVQHGADAGGRVVDPVVVADAGEVGVGGDVPRGVGDAGVGLGGRNGPQGSHRTALPRGQHVAPRVDVRARLLVDRQRRRQRRPAAVADGGVAVRVIGRTHDKVARAEALEHDLAIGPAARCLGVRTVWDAAVGPVVVHPLVVGVEAVVDGPDPLGVHRGVVCVRVVAAVRPCPLPSARPRRGPPSARRTVPARDRRARGSAPRRAARARSVGQSRRAASWAATPQRPGRSRWPRG